MLRSAIANSNHSDYDLKNSIERVSYSAIPNSKSTSNSKSENCITKYKLVLHMNTTVVSHQRNLEKHPFTLTPSGKAQRKSTVEFGKMYSAIEKHSVGRIATLPTNNNNCHLPWIHTKQQFKAKHDNPKVTDWQQTPNWMQIETRR